MSQSFISFRFMCLSSFHHFYLWYNLQLNCSIQFSATRNWGPDLPPMVPKGNGSSGRVPPSAVATDFHQSDASRGTWCGKHHLRCPRLGVGVLGYRFLSTFSLKTVENHREFGGKQELLQELLIATYPIKWCSTSSTEPQLPLFCRQVFDALPTCKRGVFHLPEGLKHE